MQPEPHRRQTTVTAAATRANCMASLPANYIVPRRHRWVCFQGEAQQLAAQVFAFRSRPVTPARKSAASAHKPSLTAVNPITSQSEAVGATVQLSFFPAAGGSTALMANVSGCRQGYSGCSLQGGRAVIGIGGVGCIVAFAAAWSVGTMSAL